MTHLQIKNTPISVLEDKWIKFFVPKIPPSIHTHHLTYLSDIITAGILATFYFSRSNHQILWLTNFLYFIRYLCDALDGALGRFRHTGLVNWGFYMDHLGDFLTTGVTILGYYLIAPPEAHLPLIVLLIILPSFWFHAALTCSITHEYRTSYGRVSPTEISIILLVVNTLIIYLGNWFIFPFAVLSLVASTAILIHTIFKTDRYLWKLDNPRFPHH